ncbi:hypothetical protein GCM10023174_26100 [Chelativorans composti]
MLATRQGDGARLKEEQSTMQAYGHRSVLTDGREPWQGGDLPARDGGKAGVLVQRVLYAGEAEQLCAGAICPYDPDKVFRQNDKRIPRGKTLPHAVQHGNVEEWINSRHIGSPIGQDQICLP